MEDVFINYRTGDGDEAAALIDQELSSRFSGKQIFRAAKSVPAGTIYPEALLDAVRKSRVLLAVIGPNWVNDSRLHDENDWVRQEINEAFKCGVVVIPILKGRKTERLRVADLPRDLEMLANAQSLRLDTRESAADLKRIGDELASLVPALRSTDRLADNGQSRGFVHNSAGNVEGTSIQGRDFSGDINSIKGNYGPVNTGTQNIYNRLDSLTNQSLASPRQQAADQFHWLAQRFVGPGNFGDAREKLQQYRAVFLDAPPGSGRGAAARMLLWEVRPESGDVQELLPQDQDEGTRFKLEQIGDNDCVWIDLSARYDIWSEVHGELSSLKAAIDRHRAYLVLILPAGVIDLDAGLSQYRVRLSKPPIAQVLSRYLKIENIPQPNSLSSILFVQENRPLREMRKYVELVNEAREKGAEESDFESWCAAASQALKNRDHDVTEVIAELKKGSQRALLLATAMLHGAHADGICQAASSLLKITDQPRDEAPLLERETLDRRFGAIRAERDSNGCVRFLELDYDSAVRNFFWTYIPEIRSSLPNWIEQTVDRGDITDDERGMLVRRFCDQSLTERYRTVLFRLVERWTSDRSAFRRIQSAALVLEHGLNNEHSGRAFRRKIYDWASASSISDSLADVIIAACRDQMAITHPAEAMVRLHHIARHESGTRARDALVQLAVNDRRFLRQILSRLTDSERKWPIDDGLFLQVIKPDLLVGSGSLDHALLAEEAIRRQLEEGWSSVFYRLPWESWCTQARQWLLFAAMRERDRSDLLDVLVRAAAGHEGLLACIYAMSCAEEIRDKISDLLLQKIDKAQGVDFD